MSVNNYGSCNIGDLSGVQSQASTKLYMAVCIDRYAQDIPAISTGTLTSSLFTELPVSLLEPFSVEKQSKQYV